MKPEEQIGKRYLTELPGGNGTITRYDAEHEAYQTKSGLWWRLVNEVLVAYRGMEILTPQKGE